VSHVFLPCHSLMWMVRPWPMVGYETWYAKAY